MKKLFIKSTALCIEDLVKKFFFTMLPWTLSLGVLLVLLSKLSLIEESNPTTSRLATIAMALLCFFLGHLLDKTICSLRRIHK